MFCTYDATCRAFIVLLFLVSLRSSFLSCLSKQSRQMAALPESASAGDVPTVKRFLLLIENSYVIEVSI